jgi:hypothetical protein
MLCLFRYACVLSFFLIAVFPSFTLLLAPLLLGLPHVVSDIYLLLVREKRIHRSAISIALVLCAALILHGIGLEFLGLEKFVDESLLIATLVVSPVMLLTLLQGITLGSWIAIVIAVLIVGDPVRMMILMAYLHNIVAMLFLFCNSKSSSKEEQKTAYLALGLLILGSVASFYLGRIFFTAVTDPSLEIAWSLIPSPVHPLSAPLLFLFGYTQVLHLIIWAGILPFGLPSNQERRFIHAINLGLVLIVLFLLLIFAGLLEEREQLQNVRSSYLVLVSFHGWLELSWILIRVHTVRREGQPLYLRTVMNLSDS